MLEPGAEPRFRDHYLDVELDLSNVMFIATANVADTIPGPLLDRMEVIRFDGYTTTEKVAIARGYLWPRQLERNGLRPDEVEISDQLLKTIAIEYTHEAGVRQLERDLGTLLRKTATLIASGSREAPVTIDLDGVRTPSGASATSRSPRSAPPSQAWRRVSLYRAGGDVLFVEATGMQGKPGLTLTGQLGDVMKGARHRSLCRTSAVTPLTSASTAMRSTTVRSTSTRERGRYRRTARGRRDDGYRVDIAAQRLARQAHGRNDR